MDSSGAKLDREVVMAKTKKPRLGRGLSSLLSKPVAIEMPADQGEKSAPEEATPPPEQGADGHADRTKPDPENTLSWIKLHEIVANPYQPRRTFEQKSLEELATSIRQEGVIQPVVVRADDRGGYQLIAGERRWRAAKLAELEAIPALVRTLDDQAAAEWAIVENLQREDLDPIERADAFARLADQFKLTHQQIAERIGSDRTTITNLIRLLDLPEDIRELIRIGQLSGGHGRTLLGLSDSDSQLALARNTVKGDWSVRRLEQAVRDASEEKTGKRRQTAARSAHLRDLEKQASSQLSTKVRIKPGRKKGSGTLSIDFFDLDHFDQLMSKLGVQTGD